MVMVITTMFVAVVRASNVPTVVVSHSWASVMPTAAPSSNNMSEKNNPYYDVQGDSPWDCAWVGVSPAQRCALEGVNETCEECSSTSNNNKKKKKNTSSVVVWIIVGIGFSVVLWAGIVAAACVIFQHRPDDPKATSEEDLEFAHWESSKVEEAEVKKEELASVGDSRPLSELVEYLFNREVVAKLREFKRFRTVRGDGDGYYRSVAFGVVEAYAGSGRARALARLVATFRAVKISMIIEKDSPDVLAEHDALVSCLETAASHLSLYPDTRERVRVEIEARLTEPRLDLALVRAARCLVAEFILDNRAATVATAISRLDEAQAAYHARGSFETKLGGDGTVLPFALALQVEGGADAVPTSAQLRSILAMGEEARDVVCDLPILPRLMGVDLHQYNIFHGDKVRLHGGDDVVDAVAIDILFNAGHYFLLYK
ncbi:hypothetical protein CTAYLR_008144 [Chrysophaeum taylorii]|uniref:Uncharacterized protein n=1 Tax=Chrysophaeum taylorii TaxID=2483200 RepID=A0AAD7XL26_9STRA|nr:hypothetical protein CTAYLR_008144 [Chrysophaeum taylorii]